MDGYEACLRIDEYLHINESINQRRPFIYALTPDSNPETKEKIKKHEESSSDAESLSDFEEVKPIVLEQSKTYYT